MTRPESIVTDVLPEAALKVAMSLPEFPEIDPGAESPTQLVPVTQSELEFPLQVAFAGWPTCGTRSRVAMPATVEKIWGRGYVFI
jgi:hypothetical protein